MNLAKMRDHLSVISDGYVPPAEKSIIERHVQACKQCVEDPGFLSGVMDIIEEMNRKS